MAKLVPTLFRHCLQAGNRTLDRVHPTRVAAGTGPGT
jgi:hypothetical protein